MAFEDLYYQSPSQGLLNFRYQPLDRTQIAAIVIASETPGQFCMARVSVKYGVQVKKNITAASFSLIKDTLLEEFSVSLAQMEPELRRVEERERVLTAAEPIETPIWKNFMDNENEPIKYARNNITDMTNVIEHWSYREGLCTYSA